jgi:hypothetical protein
MNLVDGLADLLHNRSYLGLRHWLTAFELMIKLSSCAHFKNDVDISLICEIPIHFDDVRMVQKLLYLQLTNKLLSYILLNQQPLLNHLQSTREASTALSTSLYQYRTRDTCPYFPEPNYLIFLKSATLSTLFLPNDDFTQIYALPELA